MCDFRTVDPKDIVPVELVVTKGDGGHLVVKYNKNQKWMYFYGMKPEEVVLIKI